MVELAAVDVTYRLDVSATDISVLWPRSRSSSPLELRLDQVPSEVEGKLEPTPLRHGGHDSPHGNADASACDDKTAGCG